MLAPVEFVDLTQDPYWNFEQVAEIYWPPLRHQDKQELWLETYHKLAGARLLVKGLHEWDEACADAMTLMDICLDHYTEARHV